MLKLIAIAWEIGIIVYDVNIKIIVIPPKKPLKKSNFRFVFLFTKEFCFKKNGNSNNTPRIFLKNACSMGWINCEVNFIRTAKTENKKQEIINNDIGCIFLLRITS